MTEPLVDLHCHILPDVDDGPVTMDEALDMARVAVDAGIGTIVATPHVSWDYPHVDAALVTTRVQELNAALEELGVPLEVLPGAEIALSRGIVLSDEELHALRLGGSPYVMVECPLGSAAVGFEHGLWDIRGRGHRILLAHPERSPGLRRDRGQLERLVHAGDLTQVTAGALTGVFGREVQRFARELLADGLCNVVATDAHSARRRPPSLQAELFESGLDDHRDILAASTPRAILRGDTVPPAPHVGKPRRSWLRRSG